MEIVRSNSTSTLGSLPDEKRDPTFEHMKKEEGMNRRGDLSRGSSGNTALDLEAQSDGQSLTRGDTAAWVTKHPSRIPDEGTLYSGCAERSDEKEGIELYCRL
jgi:hypothetical protein